MILFLDSNFNLNTFFNNYNKKLNDILDIPDNECDFIDLAYTPIPFIQSPLCAFGGSSII